MNYIFEKFKLKAGDGKTEEKYRFYSSSQDKIMYYDEYEFEEKSILLGRGGSPSIHLAEKFCISHDDVYVLKPNIKIINIKYLYIYLLNNKQLLVFTGNGLKHLSKENINSIQIPVPSLEVQEEIIKRIESLEQESSHYNQYAKMLQTELDNITEIIGNMTTASKDNIDINEEKVDETNDEQYNEQVDETVDEQYNEQVDETVDEQYNEQVDETNDEQYNEQVDETVDEQYNEQVDETVDEQIKEHIEESDDESIKSTKPKKDSKKKKKVQTIEYKDKTYILEDNKVYKMDEDGNKGKQYGNLVDGKVKKLKSIDISI